MTVDHILNDRTGDEPIKIVLGVDNMATMACLRRRWSTNQLANLWMEKLDARLVKERALLEVLHVRGVDNASDGPV